MANKKDTHKEKNTQNKSTNNADNLSDKNGEVKGHSAKKTDSSGSTSTNRKTSSKKSQDIIEDKTDIKDNTLQTIEEKLAEAQDKYLRLSAEFDNYRKRTLKEKMDLTKSAGESIMTNILPVMDDFDRALQLMEDASDCKAMKDGIDLIYSKFSEFLKGNGVKEIDALHKEFDTDLHEAITKIPAPDKKLKGKVVDIIQKGYYLNDRVMRYAKVVIGE